MIAFSPKVAPTLPIAKNVPINKTVSQGTFVTAALVPMENSGMRAGGEAIISSDVEMTAIAGEGTSTTEYTVGEYKGTVKSGVTIYSGSDGEKYYSINGGPKYLLTTSNYMNALTVTINNSGQTEGTQTEGTQTDGEQTGDETTTG